MHNSSVLWFQSLHFLLPVLIPLFPFSYNSVNYYSVLCIFFFFNTQNAVQQAQFVSNRKFHEIPPRISRKINRRERKIKRGSLRLLEIKVQVYVYLHGSFCAYRRRTDSSVTTHNWILSHSFVTPNHQELLC